MADPVEARPFGVRFTEAVDYLRGKLPEGTLRSDDLAGPVNSKIFAVAGAVKADLLRDLQDALVTAKADGRTITDFRKDFDKAVAEHGWTYKGKRGWRTRVIFDNNMRSAAMAGRWAQIQDNKKHQPFLQYRTAGDSRVRPMHRLWNGLIYRVDDPFWQTHYPPNGWGCRCTVRAYAQADLDEKNLQLSEPFDMKEREVVTRDGEIKDRVPIGIDPGWDHNVGQSWIAPEVALGQKLARLPRELQGTMADKAMSPAFQKVLGDNFKAFRKAVEVGKAPANAAQVVGFLDGATLDALAAQVPAVAIDSSAVIAQVNVPTASATVRSKSVSDLLTNLAETLPAQLRDYQAVLWDTERRALVVVPSGRAAGLLPTVELQPGARTNIGQAIRVTEIGTQTPATLRNGARYQLLVGKVGE